jgi:hypothetical protein
MGGCINPSLGKLLHAYELKSLTPEETDRFELHLLECDHCFNEVSSMVDEIGTMLYDEPTKQAITDLAGQPLPSAEPVSFWRHFWPFRTPLLLRPGFIYALLVIALIPAYIGVSSLITSKAHPIQSIGLYQTRSVEIPILDKSRGSDAVINFLLDNFSRNDILSVTIKGNDGRAVYANENFTGVDDQGIGRLYLEFDRFKAGSYTLEVINRKQQSPADRSVFEFTIK